MAKKIEAKDDLQAAIRDLMAKPKPPEIAKPPEGWKTAKEWAQIIGKGKTQTRVKINQLLDAGEWEEMPFALINRAGSPLPVPHYRKKSS